MAITVRNEETLKQLEKLATALDIKTLTGVIDEVVMRHLSLIKELKEARKTIASLDNELSEIKTVIRGKVQADETFSEMCDKIK